MILPSRSITTRFCSLSGDGYGAGASDAKNSRVGAPLRNSSPPKERVVIAPGGGVAWPRPVSGYHFNRKSIFAIRRSSFELVNLSRANLLNKLLHGLTHILLINRPAFAKRRKRASPPKQLPPVFWAAMVCEGGGQLKPRVGRRKFHSTEC